MLEKQSARGGDPQDGRSALRSLIDRELVAETRDPGSETEQLDARLEEFGRKIDSVIDLAAATPDHKDLSGNHLARLRLKRR